MDPCVPPSTTLLKEAIAGEGKRLGFLSIGVTDAAALQKRVPDLTHWLASGFSGGLAYMENFFERQRDLLKRFPDLKSILVLTIPYANGARPPALPNSGQIARYAWGRNYHRVIEKKLKQLETFIQTQAPETQMNRCIDTSPIQERALAEMAGLGFIGKNTCLILPKGGSFVFLAAILTNLELPSDQPMAWDCGSCTLCLESCPTQALRPDRPYELDAGRCIAYLTIENKGTMDPALRPSMQNWLFGCDICQEVCPYNGLSKDTQWKDFLPEGGAGPYLSLLDVLSIKSDEEFKQRFAGTPVLRAKRFGLQRNAVVVAVDDVRGKGSSSNGCSPDEGVLV